MSRWREEPGPCRDCGQPSTVEIYTSGDYERRYPQRCRPCQQSYNARKDAYDRAVETRLSGLNQRDLNCLKRAFDGDEIASIDALLALTDEQLLTVRMFGRKALAAYRAIVPAPIPNTAPGGHPETFWAARPDVLSVVGG